MTSTDAAKGIDRRTLLRASAAAAWSAPLVVGVTAAPAFAACSGPANLSAAGSITRANGVYTIDLTVTNSGGSATQGLLATLTSSTAPVQNPSSPAGWSGTKSPWTAGEQIGSCGSKSFYMTFSVNSGHIGKSNTVTVTFTTTDGTSGTFSKSF